MVVPSLQDNWLSCASPGMSGKLSLLSFVVVQQLLWEQPRLLVSSGGADSGHLQTLPLPQSQVPVERQTVAPGSWHTPLWLWEQHPLTWHSAACATRGTDAMGDFLIGEMLVCSCGPQCRLEGGRSRVLVRDVSVRIDCRAP